jgi:hypothetical protein
LDQELNYHNYFTEIERFFQSKRRSFTLLSSLDWVLMENWKQQGIPLDVVLKGIDRAFSSPNRKRDIGSLAYCVKAIEKVAEEQKDLGVDEPRPPEFGENEVRAYLVNLAQQVRDQGFPQIALGIEQVDSGDLRNAEQQLSALEEKLVAHMTVQTEDALLAGLKRAVDSELNPFRSTMTVDQLARLEQQLKKRKLLEQFGLPHLSLFYLI